VPCTTPGEDWRALLTQQPFIRYDRTSFGGRLVDRFLRQQAPVQEVCELDESDAIVGLVAQSGAVPQTAAQTTTPGRWPAGVRAGPGAADLPPRHRPAAPGRDTLGEPVRDLIDRIRAAYPA
jgi:hypothetical protein